MNVVSLRGKHSTLMKYKGSTSDFVAHRNMEVLKSFRRAYAEAPVGMSVMEVCREAAASPSPRFWVSDMRAAIVISEMERADKRLEVNGKRALCGVRGFDFSDSKRRAMLNAVAFGNVAHGDDGVLSVGESAMGAEEVLRSMYAERREMYREIYRRYKEIRAREPRKSTVQIAADIVNNPAPRHYLTSHAVRRIIDTLRHRRETFLRE